MLTGGFDVIGLFACASPDEWKSAHAKLRQVHKISIIFSVWNRLIKLKLLSVVIS